jgi:hypothetical protein
VKGAGIEPRAAAASGWSDGPIVGRMLLATLGSV